MSLLQVEALHAAYGATEVLFGVDLAVAKGEVVALMGRNGMGKTTTIRAIFGLTLPTGGSVRFEGVELVRKGALDISRARNELGYMPRYDVRAGLVACVAAARGPAA